MKYKCDCVIFLVFELPKMNNQIVYKRFGYFARAHRLKNGTTACPAIKRGRIEWPGAIASGFYSTMWE